MIARASFDHDLRTGQAYSHRTEILLLCCTALAFLFLTGSWVKDSFAGSPEPLTATITVRQGDSLWSIAEKHGDPDKYILERVNALAQANNLGKNRMLREGQTLIIPVVNGSSKLQNGGKNENGGNAE